MSFLKLWCGINCKKFLLVPIKLFIINNDGYVSIKQTQNVFFNKQYHGSGKESGVSFPNFNKIANGFDIKYVSIKNNSEIESGILKTFELKIQPVE